MGSRRVAVFVLALVFGTGLFVGAFSRGLPPTLWTPAPPVVRLDRSQWSLPPLPIPAEPRAPKSQELETAPSELATRPGNGGTAVRPAWLHPPDQDANMLATHAAFESAGLSAEFTRRFSPVAQVPLTELGRAGGAPGEPSADERLEDRLKADRRVADLNSRANDALAKSRGDFAFFAYRVDDLLRVVVGAQTGLSTMPPSMMARMLEAHTPAHRWSDLDPREQARRYAMALEWHTRHTTAAADLWRAWRKQERDSNSPQPAGVFVSGEGVLTLVPAGGDRELDDLLSEMARRQQQVRAEIEGILRG